MKRLIFLIPALFSLLACEETGIPVFEGQRYIHFEADTTTRMVFTFATMPGTTEYTFGIPVTMIGRAQEQDLAYGVKVVTSGPLASTLPAAAYELPAAPLFRAGRYQDTLYVKFNRVAEIADKDFRLTLALESNENYTANMSLNSYLELSVGDKLVQPDWWDDNFSGTYLGPYSDIKYLAFVEATGVSDLRDMDFYNLGTYIRIFYTWLMEKEEAGTPLYEADGQTKVISTITYANL